MTFVRVKQAHKPTGKAAPRTVRKWSHSLANLRPKLSAGDTATQFAYELHMCNKEEVIEELRRTEGNFLIQVPPETSLAFKADLNIPWNKLKVMKR